MFEVRKYIPAKGKYEVLFWGYFNEVLDYLKKWLDAPEREECFLFYAGDGTEGV